MHNIWLRSFTKQLGSFPAKWAWFQCRQRTRSQSLRAYWYWENTDFWYLYLLCGIFLALKFGWVVNNTIVCGVTNSEHTFNIDFTQTLTIKIWCVRSVYEFGRKVFGKVHFTQNYWLHNYSVTSVTLNILAFNTIMFDFQNFNILFLIDEINWIFFMQTFSCLPD